MSSSGTGRFVVRKRGNKRPAGQMMNGMGKEKRSKKKKRYVMDVCLWAVLICLPLPWRPNKRHWNGRYTWNY
jgi:hypothetical protein